jgi:hypothetical protein
MWKSYALGSVGVNDKVCVPLMLEVGKRATFIVLNHNLFEIPPADISETQVLKTVFNGKEVYNK